MKTKIIFVRHGEVNNPNNIWYGRIPGFYLSKKGKSQISETAHRLAKNKIAVIYASPLLRTKQSAKIIANVLNLPIKYDSKLLEVNSSWQGKTISYINSHSDNFNIYASSTKNITGETIEELSDRVQQFINSIISVNKDASIVVVTHGDPIMIVKALVNKLPITISSLRQKDKYIKEGEFFIAEFNSQ